MNRWEISEPFSVCSSHLGFTQSLKLSVNKSDGKLIHYF
jgi:hypothetical protein